jgi:hypothetical protein
MIEFEDGKLVVPLPRRWSPDQLNTYPPELQFCMLKPVPTVYPSTKGSRLLSSDDFCMDWNSCFWGQCISETCLLPPISPRVRVDPIPESPGPVFRIRKVLFDCDIEPYSSSVRKEKIARYKAKLQKYRARVTLSRLFSGRSRSAKFKPRLNGKFMKMGADESQV